jgi:small-conductance mechanosensitive channel
VKHAFAIALALLSPNAALAQPPDQATLEDLSVPDWLSGGPLGAFVALVVMLVALFAVRRGRELLPARGIGPAALRVFEIGLRFVVFLVGVAFFARLLDPLFGDSYRYVLLATALAVGWSVRDVLPDVAGAVVLFFERRVRPGVWVSGNGFEGVVESRGLRSVWIRHASGDRIGVPNRHLLGSALRVQESLGSVHDASVRLPAGVPAAIARRALVDAVLTSPQVSAKAPPVIRRSGTDPTLWHVRAHLIDGRFAARFEGEILERAEEILEARSREVAS